MNAGTTAARHKWGVSDAEWAAGQMDTIPASWAGQLLQRWEAKHKADHVAANRDLLRRVNSIRAAYTAGVPADANDDAICQCAADSARDMARRLALIDVQAKFALEGVADAERLGMLGRYLDALHWMTLRGLAHHLRQQARRGIAGALRRLVCERWWRRILRRAHAVAVEGTARAIGLVHKRAGCYVSDESAARRRGQAARNFAALSSVQAINDDGQAYTLAELAAKGTANKAIRRHELMTRIAGFETIARDLGHLGDFVTLTCPSRMHAWRTAPGRKSQTEANPHHDGTTPDVAQAYMCKQWGRFRAAADRRGLGLYGFRIAEPNHDGTPHWHALLFFPPLTERGVMARAVMLRLLRRYFLFADMPADLAARRAACRARIKVERIDWTRGSAAGYVAKYVAKNIDGMHVDKDLYGNDTLTSSQRVEAWASTWRVRQFQQVGGAPVGIWRELRRLHPEQAGAAPAVAAGLDAANVQPAGPDATDIDKQRTAAHGWADYLRLQGGHRVKRRSLRLKLLKEETGEIGRYGELMAAVTVGVVTVDSFIESRPALGIVKAMNVRRTTRHEVESQRCAWIIVPMGTAGVHVPMALAPTGGTPRKDMQRPVKPPSADGGRRMTGVPPVGVGSMGIGEAAAPWSPVNNCTGAALDVAPGDLFAPAIRRHEKRRRAFDWAGHRANRRPPPAKPEEAP